MTAYSDVVGLGGRGEQEEQENDKRAEGKEKRKNGIELIVD